jgi:hypothetical protein
MFHPYGTLYNFWFGLNIAGYIYSRFKDGPHFIT